MENNNQNLPQPLPVSPPASFWGSHKSVVIVICLAAAASVAVAAYFILNQPHDLGPVVAEHKTSVATSTAAERLDDSDLRPQKVSVPDADNGFFDLNALDLQKDFYVPTKQEYPYPTSGEYFGSDYLTKLNAGSIKWDQVLVDKVLSTDQKVLNAVSAAAGEKYFQIPELADPSLVADNLPAYNVNIWRAASRLQALKALSVSWQGKPDDALVEALKLSQLGHNQVGGNGLRGDGLDFQTLIGIATQRLGSQTILQILPYGQPSQDSLHKAIAALQLASDDNAAYKNSYKMDYIRISNLADKYATQPGKFLDRATEVYGPDSSSTEAQYQELFSKYPNIFDPIATKYLYAKLYRTEIAAVGNRCSMPEYSSSMAFDMSVLLGMQYSGQQISEQFHPDNILGKLSFSLTGGNQQVLVIECNNDLNARVAEVEIALKAYKQDNGSLPSTLVALVPKYLSAVPLDPFDNLPLKYSSDKKIIFSVGIDGKGGGEVQNNNEPLSAPNPIAFQVKF